MVNQRLDAFELQVLECPTPTIYLTTLQEALSSLRADVDKILERRGPEPKTTPVELVDETVLAALFTTPTKTPPYPPVRAKRYRSIRITEGEDDCALPEIVQTNLEAARRASFIDEETR